VSHGDDTETYGSGTTPGNDGNDWESGTPRASETREPCQHHYSHNEDISRHNNHLGLKLVR